MPVAVIGVVTTTAREKWARTDVHLDTHPQLKFFRFGMGGWEDSGGRVLVPRTPDPTLTDLDCIINPSRYPGAAELRFVWDSWLDYVSPNLQRFQGGDLWYEIPRTAVARCLINFDESNDRGDGEAPEFWEMGIFDEDGDMVVYATFPKETKTEDVELEKEVRITR